MAAVNVTMTFLRAAANLGDPMGPVNGVGPLLAHRNLDPIPPKPTEAAKCLRAAYNRQTRLRFCQN